MAVALPWPLHRNTPRLTDTQALPASSELTMQLLPGRTASWQQLHGHLVAASLRGPKRQTPRLPTAPSGAISAMCARSPSVRVTPTAATFCATRPGFRDPGIGTT